jgi:hypothetical protein
MDFVCSWGLGRYLPQEICMGATKPDEPSQVDDSTVQNAADGDGSAIIVFSNIGRQAAIEYNPNLQENMFTDGVRTNV